MSYIKLNETQMIQELINLNDNAYNYNIQLSL
jgi:hypothetical protein